MSLEIVRGVDRDYPALLQQNVNRTCYAFVVEVIKRLRAEGHQAFHVAKSPGEGQYVPAGFVPRTVTGLDGKPYPCSGVSHDALWCDGLQFDTIGRGNDSPDPIGMTGEPVWNAIPQQYWRPNNPPLMENGPQPVPMPGPTRGQPYPGDDVWDVVGITLFSDYAAARQSANPQMGRWFGRVIWDATAGDESGRVWTVPDSIKKHRNEWRAALGLPPIA